MRYGCVESRFDIGCQFGPVTLDECVDRCEQHRFEFLTKLLPANGVGRWRDGFPLVFSESLKSPIGGSCGAVAFYPLQVPPLPPQRGRDRRGRNKFKRPEAPPRNESVGFCQLKAYFCKDSPYVVRFGNCTDDIRWSRRFKRGWCTHLLGPVPDVSHRPNFAHRPRLLADLATPCAPERELGATDVAMPPSHAIRSSTGSARWINRTRAKIADTDKVIADADKLGTAIYLEAVGNGQVAVLGGGLNNMLMGLAQLLADSCSSASVLLLPPLDSDPLRSSNFWDGNAKGCNSVTGSHRRFCAWNERPQAELVAFADVFDLAAFQRLMWPMLCGLCKRPAWCGAPRDFVVAEAPPGARVLQVQLAQLHSGTWRSHPRYIAMLAAIYRAVRPSPAVLQLVQVLVDEAHRRAGPHWAAVHLPIEKDWWWSSSWCHGRREEALTRRCYAPAEVASLTRAARRNATGTVLLYAFDKAARKDNPWAWVRNGVNESAYGPSVCLDAFGETTFKLQLPSTIPYTFRNAAEQFFAARAPAGFFGNSYSTFSKGIALLRAAPGGDGRSFAYDCANLEKQHWTSEATGGIVAMHPGFPLLLPLSSATSNASAGGAEPEGGHDDHCGTAFSSPEVTSEEAVREQVRRYREKHFATVGR